MAATRATCEGIAKSGRRSHASRLGHAEAHATANTWRTFTSCHVNADGSGYISVTRDAVLVAQHEFGPETPALGHAEEVSS